MNGQKEQNKLEQISLVLFSEIVKFLDVQSISQLVLVSRNMRLNVGQVLNKCLSIQQKYYKYIRQQTFYALSYFEYKELLQDRNIFLDDQVYSEFVNWMTFENRYYFVNFFSAVFNVSFKIKDAYQLKKQELIDRQKDVFTSLIFLSQTNDVPKLDNKYIFLQCFNPTLKNIVDFVNKFLKKLAAMQQMNSLLDALIVYQQQKWEYLNKYKKITDIKIQQQYKQRIYYLKFEKTYHQIINFNVNSVILSFLNVKDLQKLRFVDKMFNHLVKSISLINYKNLFRSIEKNLNQQTSQKELNQIGQLTVENSKIQMSLYQFMASSSSTQSPIYVDKLINILLICLGYDPVNYTIQSFLNSSRIYAYIFTNSQNVELNEQTYNMLDAFFSEDVIQQIKAQNNTLLTKICTILEIHYLMKKYQISQEKLNSYCENMKYLNKKIEYALKFKIYAKRINNP